MEELHSKWVPEKLGEAWSLIVIKKNKNALVQTKSGRLTHFQVMSVYGILV